jgi:hypothetical protein
LNRSAGVLAFVLQHLLEHSPTGIEHGLCHPCLNQREAAHVSNDDGLIRINNLSGTLMQRILTAARRFPVDALGLPLVSSPLRLSELICEALRPPPRLEPLPVARDGDVLKPKVDPHSLPRRAIPLDWHRHR